MQIRNIFLQFVQQSKPLNQLTNLAQNQVKPLQEYQGLKSIQSKQSKQFFNQIRQHFCAQAEIDTTYKFILMQNHPPFFTDSYTKGKGQNYTGAPYHVDFVKVGSQNYPTNSEIKVSNYQRIKIDNVTYKNISESIQGEIYSPDSIKINSYVQWAQEEGVQWAKMIGLVVDTIKEEKKLYAAKFSLLAAVCYPTATAEDLLAHTKLITWLFFHDDRVDNPLYKTATSPTLLVELNSILGSILDGNNQAQTQDPLVRAFTELHAYYSQKATENSVEYYPFSLSLKQYFQASENLVQKRADRLDTSNTDIYRQWRDNTSAVDTVIWAELITKGVKLNQEQKDDLNVINFLKQINICICDNNDFFSFKKELAADPSYNENILIVLLKKQEALHETLSIQKAFDEAILHINSSREELQKLISLLNKNVAFQQLCATGKNWDVGCQFWHQHSARYDLVTNEK